MLLKYTLATCYYCFPQAAYILSLVPLHSSCLSYSLCHECVFCHRHCFLHYALPLCFLKEKNYVQFSANFSSSHSGEAWSHDISLQPNITPKLLTKKRLQFECFTENITSFVWNMKAWHNKLVLAFDMTFDMNISH
jgi:hypothetical protein